MMTSDDWTDEKLTIKWLNAEINKTQLTHIRLQYYYLYKGPKANVLKPAGNILKYLHHTAQLEETLEINLKAKQLN